MPKTDISATDAARILRVPYQTLNRWIKAGTITCDEAANGAGARRRFTAKDVALTYRLLRFTPRSRRYWSSRASDVDRSR
jgi:DNA-binding transcriptional MerR regulator